MVGRATVSSLSETGSVALLKQLLTKNVKALRSDKPSGALGPPPNKVPTSTKTVLL